MKQLRIVLALAAVVLAFAQAWAGGFEQPPSFDADKVLGSVAQGPGYKILNPVGSDGYLRNYTIETSFGTFYASGDQMLLMRVKELRALDALNKTFNSQQFAGALIKAGLSPLRFAGNLVVHPVDTVDNTLTGMGQMVSGMASGIRNAGKTQDGTVASLTGASTQKRLIAYQYGVDPYTDFKPLDDRLDAMAAAAAAGKLVVTAAFMAIPGAAGTIVSNVSTANSLSDKVRDLSAAELMDLNRKKLAELGIRDDLIEALLQNRFLTPVDATVIADALTRIGRIQNIDVMVERAATATSRDMAYFIRKRIEMIAAYQEKNHTLNAFIRFSAVPFPLTLTADNGVIAIFPIDILSWTEDTGHALTGLSNDAREFGISGPRVFYMSGKTTELARKELKALGWKLEEGVRG